MPRITDVDTAKKIFAGETISGDEYEERVTDKWRKLCLR